MDLKEKLDDARERLTRDLDVYRGLVALLDAQDFTKTLREAADKALPFAELHLRGSINALVQASEAMGTRP